MRRALGEFTTTERLTSHVYILVGIGNQTSVGIKRPKTRGNLNRVEVVAWAMASNI